MIEYQSGVRGIVDVRWHSKIIRDECRIRGTDGEIEMSPLNGPDLVWPAGRENLPAHPNLHYPMIENFVDAVEGQEGTASQRSDILLDRLGHRPSSSCCQAHVGDSLSGPLARGTEGTGRNSRQIATVS